MRRSSVRFYYVTVTVMCLMLMSIVVVITNDNRALRINDIENDEIENIDLIKSSNDITDERSVIHLAIVICGERLNESLVVLKSSVLLTKKQLKAHIFVEDHLKQELTKQLTELFSAVSHRFSYALYPVEYPSQLNAVEWRKLFKLCASLRLFIPEILAADVDSILYVDTDIIFLRPVDDVWSFLSEFNSTQIAALTPENEEPTAAWYSRFARHPYVPPHGVNSGVMLMNLTRMRSVDWVKTILSHYARYKYDITCGDQDLINIYFHFFPDRLYVYPCAWNYRPDHCMYMPTCQSAQLEGVSVLHGSRGVYHSDKQTAFRAVYSAYSAHELGKSAPVKLLEHIKLNLNSTTHSACGKVSELFIKQFTRQVEQHSDRLM